MKITIITTTQQLKKLKLFYNKIMSCEKVKLSKNNLDFARNKVGVISQSKTWKV